jgi:hypothetical protein
MAVCEKLVCGLVDLKVFADFDEALPLALW